MSMLVRSLVVSPRLTWSGRFLAALTFVRFRVREVSRSTGGPLDLAIEAPHFVRGALSRRCCLASSLAWCLPMTGEASRRSAHSRSTTQSRPAVVPGHSDSTTSFATGHGFRSRQLHRIPWPGRCSVAFSVSRFTFLTSRAPQRAHRAGVVTSSCDARKSTQNGSDAERVHLGLRATQGGFLCGHAVLQRPRSRDGACKGNLTKREANGTAENIGFIRSLSGAGGDHAYFWRTG